MGCEQRRGGFRKGPGENNLLLCDLCAALCVFGVQTAEPDNFKSLWLDLGLSIMQPTVYKLLADLLLVAHFGIVAFVVLGVVLVWVGYFARWRWVRNGWFRLAHLVTMGVVAAQAVFGQICPLTIWENRLREAAGATARYETSFIQHWVGRLLFYDANPTVFTIAYLAFFAGVVLSWIVVKPAALRFRRRGEAASGNEERR